MTEQTPWQDMRQIGDCTLYLGDCSDVMPVLKGVDAVVTDPPYGIGEAAGKNKSRSKKAVSKDFGNKQWDDAPLSGQLLTDVLNLAGKQIIFGGNYFQLPPTSCWLVWDKENGRSDFADCELAWTNLPKAVRLIRFMWNGMLRANGEDRGDHPTQKPIEVMRWCLSHVPDAKTICDPFMGSGTTGVACARDGRSFIGIERDPEYFEIACRRIEKAYCQPDMLALLA
jgi:DNA modification methylase